MASTLLLNPSGWDLMVDNARNIAVASQPYSLAQDSASAIRLFQGEDYYETTKGVPYWDQILGHYPPISIMKAYFIAAALTVPGVVAAQCFIESILDRRPKGQVLVTGESGAQAAVSFAQQKPPLPTPVFPGGTAPSLDFSKPGNSQYLPMIG